MSFASQILEVNIFYFLLFFWWGGWVVFSPPYARSLPPSVIHFPLPPSPPYSSLTNPFPDSGPQMQNRQKRFRRSNRSSRKIATRKKPFKKKQLSHPGSFHLSSLNSFPCLNSIFYLVFIFPHTPFSFPFSQLKKSEQKLAEREGDRGGARGGWGGAMSENEQCEWYQAQK